jgi:serine/threonine protein kinase
LVSIGTESTALDNYVGPYRILRLINRGGQGSIYLGYDKRLHRRVAIKICALPRTRAERKHLLREARLVASIQSPKVVQIHDVIESSTHLGLVMEYVPGCSLEDFLTAMRPSLPSVLTVGADVAGALALARQQHIVHGDVKAGNVLIAESGRAKLTDFGIARAASSGAAPPLMGGSLSALSPEQFLGESLDARADLFSLGSLLYRMLSGEHPFFRNGQFDPEMLVKHSPRPLVEIVSGDVELPDPLIELIDELLQKNPQHRPRTTRRVRQVLRAVQLSLPLSSRDSLLRESQPYFRRESPEDLPPLIPEGLGPQGRSALLPANSRAGRLWRKMKTLKWPARIAATFAVIAIVMATVTLAIALQNRLTPVRFDEPVTSVAPGMELPQEISNNWLLLQVKLALGEELGNLKVVGPVGAVPDTTLYSRGKPRDRWLLQEQIFHIALHCDNGFCVFAVSREEAGTHFEQQGVLLANMSSRQWQDIVRSTTLALYR